ncbi:MAG: two-component system, cell cycle sensor histidine kinase and response regulator CckA [Verrucomicrobiota bacterium]|jgi:CheY-like chemotaxis protein
MAMEDKSENKRVGPVESNPISQATSELNNMLQIIAGTSSLIENIWEGADGSEKYLAMLRTSIERAEKVTAELAQYAGGSNKKAFMHPEIAGFLKTKSKASADIARHTLLLVDDEEMGLMLVKRLLCEAGFHVITAQSGFECLDIFRRGPHNFDLVLLDFTMPFMDGEETFERMREIRPDIPVVLCAGFIEHERLERMLLAGLSGFLRKPFAPDEIVSHVRSLLEGMKFMGTDKRSEMPVAI